MKSIISGVLLLLLFMGPLTLAVGIKPTKSEWTGTVYIRADGSIDPPDAPIITYDNITYILTDNIVSSEHGIVVQRPNIIVDGRRHTIEGAWNFTFENLPESEFYKKGVDLRGVWNVTVKNVKVKNFHIGVHIVGEDNNVTGNDLKNNLYGVDVDGLRNSVTKNNITNNLDGVYIRADYNIIAENNITNNDEYGISLDSSSNAVITGNYITNNYFGIRFVSSYNNIVSRNIFVNDGLFLSGFEFVSPNNVVVNNTVNGKPLVYLENVSNETISDPGQIILVNCNRIRVENLSLSYTDIGIELWNTTNTIIAMNNITNCLRGIYLDNSFNNTIFANNLTNNEEFGVYLRQSNNNNIHQNVFVDNGLHISQSHSNIIVNNLVNGKPLIYLQDASDITIEDAGQVILVRCSRVRVENLNLSHASVGVELHYTNYTIISGNDLTNNRIGVFLYESSLQNDVSRNNIASNLCGVYMAYAEQNNISSNTITNSEVGIFLYFSPENVVYENNVLNNYYGVVLPHSEGNMFYHNNFINNTLQVVCTHDYNIFDAGYPTGGNYWSDYDGTDLDGDSIGDSPYVIDEYNADYYPLMGPWTPEGLNVSVMPSNELTITFENVTSSGVTTVSQTDVGLAPPFGFKLAEKYYNITTTANHLGTIKLRIFYDDSNMTKDEESNLRLMQWDETTEQWVDITTYLDIESNIIYGETTHFSIFGMFTIPAHDVAILNVKPSRTIIGQGYPSYINVDVLLFNYGNCTEDFRLDVYVNSSLAQSFSGVLAGENFTIIGFSLNVTGLAKGIYNVTAHLQPIQNETDTSDNIYTIWVYVTIAGDVTSITPEVPDYRVDMRDIGALCSKFMATPSSPEWNPNYDINNDNIINMRDIGIACSNYMKET